MSGRAFQFALAASLDKARADLRGRESALAAAERIRREEESRRGQCVAALEATLSKIAASRETLATPRSGRVDREDLYRIHRYLNGLETVAARERDRLRAANKRLELAVERVRIRRREVEAAFNQANALDKIRIAREAEHAMTVRRAQSNNESA